MTILLETGSFRHGARAARALLLTLAAVLGLAACGDEPARRSAAAGEPAPEFRAVALDGDSVALAALQGSAVVLNVWATWCAPCREEMPGLQALQETYAADGLRVVGVSIDSRRAVDEVRQFLTDQGIGFTIWLDPDERVTRAFRTMGVPETFLIDRDGVLRQRWIGKIDPMAPEIRAAVEAALAGESVRAGRS